MEQLVGTLILLVVFAAILIGALMWQKSSTKRAQKKAEEKKRKEETRQKIAEAEAEWRQQPHSWDAPAAPEKPKEEPKKDDGVTFKATGMAYHMDGLEKIAVENWDYGMTNTEVKEEYEPYDRIYEYEYPVETVELVPEPDNEADPNAIAVHVNGEKVAYIKRGSTTRARTLLASGNRKITAEVYGGPYKMVEEDDDGRLTVTKGESPMRVIIKIK